MSVGSARARSRTRSTRRAPGRGGRYADALPADGALQPSTALTSPTATYGLAPVWLTGAPSYGTGAHATRDEWRGRSGWAPSQTARSSDAPATPPIV